MTDAQPRWDPAGSRGHPEDERAPGGALRHPLVLAMLVLWAVNDHVLKSALANLWTGKLSDIASLCVFPLLPLCVYELLCAYRGLQATHKNAVLLVSIVATGAVMAGINTSDLCAEVYRVGLGAAQWPFRALWGLVSEGTIPPLRRVLLTMDATDLWTLPALLIPWRLGQDKPAPREARRAT